MIDVAAVALAGTLGSFLFLVDNTICFCDIGRGVVPVVPDIFNGFCVTGGG